jgi:adenylate cyclase
MELLNIYLTQATDCIHRAGGVIDKYMGYEVMGQFNSQLNPLEDHAARAVQPAQNIREAFVTLYREQGIDPKPHYYRIGMHTGIATLGNVGSEIRRDFTAIGDSINLSKRLEENAVPGQIIISEDTRQHTESYPGSLGSIRLEEREAIKVKGRQQPTRIYEVFDNHVI